MERAQPTLQDPPERQRWEEPPPGGWSSTLGNVALELAWLAAVIALGVGGLRLLVIARRLGAGPVEGWRLALVIAVWSAVCLAAAAVGVFVWRRLGGLFLLAAMFTDFGRAARLRGRPPVFLDAAPAGGLRLAQLSDLHVTETDDTRLVEAPRPGGNDVLEELLLRPELDSADLVLVTGDVTDRGTAVAWRRFHELVEEHGLGERLLLVPGNHDLGLLEVLDGKGRRVRQRVLRADRFAVVHLANLLKFAEAFAQTAGGRRGFVLSPDGEDLVPFEDAFRAVEREVRPLLLALPERPAPPVRLRSFFADRRAVDAYRAPIEAARDKLLALFPVAFPMPTRDAVVFVLNTTTAPCHHPSTNALGRIGRPQYRRLERLARFFGQKLRLIAMHHHLVRRTEEGGMRLFARLLAKFTVLGDPRPLVRFCKSQGVRAVLHGHRHLSYQLRIPDGPVLLAAPSSTLGDELARDPRPHVELYTILPEPVEPTCGIHRQVVHP